MRSRRPIRTRAIHETFRSAAEEHEIDYLNKGLGNIAAADKRMVHVDFTGEFLSPDDWHDPIHLTSDGYEKAARIFLSRI